MAYLFSANRGRRGDRLQRSQRKRRLTRRRRSDRDNFARRQLKHPSPVGRLAHESSADRSPWQPSTWWWCFEFIPRQQVSFFVHPPFWFCGRIGWPQDERRCLRSDVAVRLRFRSGIRLLTGRRCSVGFHFSGASFGTSKFRPPHLRLISWLGASHLRHLDFFRRALRDDCAGLRFAGLCRSGDIST